LVSHPRENEVKGFIRQLEIVCGAEGLPALQKLMRLKHERKQSLHGRYLVRGVLRPTAKGLYPVVFLSPSVSYRLDKKMSTDIKQSERHAVTAVYMAVTRSEEIFESSPVERKCVKRPVSSFATLIDQLRLASHGGRNATYSVSPASKACVIAHVRNKNSLLDSPGLY
jgi:hypothetical protein